MKKKVVFDSFSGLKAHLKKSEAVSEGGEKADSPRSVPIVIKQSAKPSAGSPQGAKPPNREPVRPKRRADAERLAQRKDTSRHHGDLNVYGPAKPKQAAVKPAPLQDTRSLEDVSADLGRLSVRMPTENPKPGKSSAHSGAWPGRLLRSSAENSARSSPAVVGFDFGTAFTKAVVRWEGRAYPIDWGNAALSQHGKLLPSVFSEFDDGRLQLGHESDGASQSFQGLKAALLQMAPDADFLTSPVENAAAFMALALRDVRLRFLDITKSQRGSASFGRLNVGLPAAPWQMTPIRSRLERISQTAWKLALDDQPITRQRVRSTLARLGPAADPRINVIAEFAAQLASYMEAPSREDDLHALIDIGAGTVDFVSFNAHRGHGRNVLPIACSQVERLGSHYLLAALAGKSGQEHEWDDRDASQANDFFADRCADPISEVRARRNVFNSSFKAVLNDLGSRTHSWYPNSPRFASKPHRMPLFLCGGGASIEAFRNLIEGFTGIHFELRELPLPDGAQGIITQSEFPRLSVAYGLSLLARNIAEVWKEDHNAEGFTRRVIDFGDRDADR